MCTNSDNVLLHFRAGTMTYVNGIVTPDLRQGDLSFVQDGDFLNMIWTNQAKSITTPLPKGKTKVSYVEQCKTGRVLLFEVSEGASPTLHFFWLQAKSTADDADYLAVLTEALVAKEPALKIKQFEKILSDIGRDKEEQRAPASLQNILYSSKVMDFLQSNHDTLLPKLSAYLPEGDDLSLVDQLKSSHAKVAMDVLTAELRDPVTVKDVYHTFNIPKAKKTGVLAFLNSILDSARKRE